MSKIDQIKNDVKRLSKADQEALLDWLTNLLEDELEMTDEFKKKIERAGIDIAAGSVRIVRPNSID
jgi:formate dehydrogenase maturation protein FdhE